MSKTQEFIRTFKKADKKYGESRKRLAGEGWNSAWKLLIATIMSAQSRDETTILIAEKLYERYGTLRKLSEAKLGDVLEIFKGLNYNKTKARNVVGTAKMLLKEFRGKVPNSIEELIRLSGVGRKTANLVLIELFGQDRICVDTHVHRISNVMGWVETKSPNQTEIALMKIAPKRYWSRINRIFVLWGKDCPGWDKERLLNSLDSNWDRIKI